MAVLSESFATEISSIVNHLKFYLQSMYNLYQNTEDEDLVEEKIIQLYEDFPQYREILKHLLIETLQTLDINQENKDLLKEIIEEALWTVKTKEKLKNSEVEKLTKEIIKRCKS